MNKNNRVFLWEIRKILRILYDQNQHTYIAQVNYIIVIDLMVVTLFVLVHIEEASTNTLAE